MTSKLKQFLVMGYIGVFAVYRLYLSIRATGTDVFLFPYERKMIKWAFGDDEIIHGNK